MSIFDNFFKIFSSMKREALTYGEFNEEVKNLANEKNITLEEAEEELKSTKYKEYFNNQQKDKQTDPHQQFMKKREEEKDSQLYKDFESHLDQLNDNKKLVNPDDLREKIDLEFKKQRDRFTKNKNNSVPKNKTRENPKLKKLNKLKEDIAESFRRYLVGLFNNTYEVTVPDRADIKNLFIKYIDNFSTDFENIKYNKIDFNDFKKETIAEYFDGIMLDLSNGVLNLTNYSDDQSKFFNDRYIRNDNVQIANKIIDEIEDDVKKEVEKYKDENGNLTKDIDKFYYNMGLFIQNKVKDEIYTKTRYYLPNLEDIRLNKNSNPDEASKYLHKLQKLYKKVLSIVWSKLKHQFIQIVKNPDYKLSYSEFSSNSVNSLNKFLHMCERIYLDQMKSSKFETTQNIHMFDSYDLSYESFMKILEDIYSLYNKIKSDPVEATSNKDKIKLLNLINTNYSKITPILDILIDNTRAFESTEFTKETHDSTIGGELGL